MDVVGLERDVVQAFAAGVKEARQEPVAQRLEQLDLAAARVAQLEPSPALAASPPIRYSPPRASRNSSSAGLIWFTATATWSRRYSGIAPPCRCSGGGRRRHRSRRPNLHEHLTSTVTSRGSRDREPAVPEDLAPAPAAAARDRASEARADPAMGRCRRSRWSHEWACVSLPVVILCSRRNLRGRHPILCTIAPDERLRKS